MSFLGLGSFGEGFVKGFAESANDALKRDIERINGRIDKVAEIRTRRALDDQAKRRDKVDSTVDRLKQGAKVIGGPNGEAYAAGLLEEYGSAGYDALLTSLQQAKLKNEGIDIGSFFERAGVDAPGQAGGQTYTLRDYAEAYLGAPKTLPTSIKMPSDDSRVGGLVSKVLGLDVDIMGRAQQRSASEIAAMGTSDSYDSSVIIPKVKFKKFAFDLEIMPFDQRLSRIEEELTTASTDDPSPVDGFANRQEYLRSLRDSTYASYIENAPDLKKLELMRTRRDTTTDETQKAELTRQINELNTTLTRRRLIEENDDLGLMQMDAADAWRAKDYDKFEDTMSNINRRTTGKLPTIQEEISQLKAKVNTVTEGSQAHTDLVTEIERLQKISLLGKFENITTEISRLQKQAAGMDRGTQEYEDIETRIQQLNAALNIGTTVTDSGFATAQRVIDGAIDREVELQLGAVGALYVEASKRIASGTTTRSQLSVDLRNAYDQGLAKRKEIESSVYGNLMQVLPPDENPAMVAVGVFRGYIENVEGTGQTATTSGASSAATGATSQTTAALGTGQTGSLNQNEVDAFLETYPDTGAAGADNLISGMGISAMDALNDPLVQQAYGPEFKQRLNELVLEDTMQQSAGEEDVSGYASDQQVAALKVLLGMPRLQRVGSKLQIEKLRKKFGISESAAKTLFESISGAEFNSSQQREIAKEIINRVRGTDLAEQRAIATELRVPMNVAKKLHEEASRDQLLSMSSVSSNRASGGLMSRP
jgi:hypothetical protein